MKNILDEIFVKESLNEKILSDIQNKYYYSYKGQNNQKSQKIVYEVDRDFPITKIPKFQLLKDISCEEINKRLDLLNNINSTPICDGVIGDDWRMPVNNSAMIPYRWICRIISVYEHQTDKNQFFIGGGGTGLFISDLHILTCAHTLVKRRRIYYSNNRMVEQSPVGHIIIPAPSIRRDKKCTSPFGMLFLHGKNYFRVPNEYISTGKSVFDYGIIYRLGPKIVSCDFRSSGFWNTREGYKFDSPFYQVSIQNKLFITSGYSGVTPCKQMVSSGYSMAYGLERYLDRLDIEKFIGFEGDTGPGFSGAPIWKKSEIVHGGLKKEVFELVAINISSVCDNSNNEALMNIGRIITPDVYEQIREWMSKKYG